ncbi:MAG: ATP-binding protein [Pseudomonadota bacterium]
MSADETSKLSWVYQLYRLGQITELRNKPQEVQQAILEHIVNGFGASGGTLALLDADGRHLIIAVGISIPEFVIGNKIEFGEGILGLVAETGRSLLLNGDITGDARFKLTAERDRSLRPHSAMCWPLMIEHRVIGTLSINRQGTREPYTEADLKNGEVVVNLITLVIENARLHIDQQQRIVMAAQMNDEIRGINKRLEETQNQLLQSERMASIGQLAAGVAHEINNPIGYVYSNLGTLERYVQDVFRMIEDYESAEGAITDDGVRARLQAAREKLDIVFLKEDLRALMDESREGITRVKDIVQDLKDFSHVDAAHEWYAADLHKGLDSTLNIVHNEIKYKAEVVKEYGDIVAVECLPSQINQVFMNLLVNAAQAIEKRGAITVRTGKQDAEVWVEITDTGKGIVAADLKRIFDPFYTTKPIGHGTGLGLSLSYSIIQKHHGRIEVQSEPGKGSVFRVWLPVQQPQMESA